MGKRTILVDDYDGSELPDGTEPVRLSLGRTTYNMYLSEANHGKLLEVLDPFIKGAETVRSSAPSGGSRSSSSNADKEKLRKVREWARATDYKYKNAKGEDVSLGDRGRIPQEVIDAYDSAH